MYLIKVMFGPCKMVKRFRFMPIADATAEDFDKAVKAINAKYKESGRYETQEEVLQHFRKYGFTQGAL